MTAESRSSLDLLEKPIEVVRSELISELSQLEEELKEPEGSKTKHSLERAIQNLDFINGVMSPSLKDYLRRTGVEINLGPRYIPIIQMPSHQIRLGPEGSIYYTLYDNFQDLGAMGGGTFYYKKGGEVTPEFLQRNWGKGEKGIVRHLAQYSKEKVIGKIARSLHLPLK